MLIPKRKLTEFGISEYDWQQYGSASIYGQYIRDATIGTAKITDLAVTDAKILTCSIGKLTAGDLSVTGTLVSGGKFVTAASPNARIEIDDTYIVGYSDATTKQFYLSAADGKAYAGGGDIILDTTGIHLRGATNERLWLEDASGNSRGVLRFNTTSDRCELYSLNSKNLLVNSDNILELEGEDGLLLYSGGGTGVSMRAGGTAASATNEDFAIVADDDITLTPGVSGTTKITRLYVDHDDTSLAEDTVYQNTGSSPFLLVISCRLDDSDEYAIKIGAANPPTTIVGQLKNGTGVGDMSIMGCTVVQPGQNFEIVTVAGTPSLLDRHLYGLGGDASYAEP